MKEIKTTSSTIVNKVEKAGYTIANKLHKFGVLSLVFFITFNIGMFFKEYNSYWKARRVLLCINFRNQIWFMILKKQIHVSQNSFNKSFIKFIILSLNLWDYLPNNNFLHDAKNKTLYLDFFSK